MRDFLGHRRHLRSKIRIKTIGICHHPNVHRKTAPALTQATR
jgi:hypothetical protein